MASLIFERPLHSAEAPEWLQAAIHDAIALGLPRVWA